MPFYGTIASNQDGTMRVAVLVGGEPQPIFVRGYDQRLFVIGTPGTAFTLQVTNNTPVSRIQVLASVDGLDVSSGEPASALSHGGEVLASGEIHHFEGSETSEAPHFTFGRPDFHVTDPTATVATSHVGVIGIAAHRELSAAARIGSTALRHSGAHPTVMFSEGVGEKVQGERYPKHFPHIPVTSYDDSDQLGIPAVPPLRIRLRPDSLKSSGFLRSYGDPDIVEIGYAPQEVLIANGIITAPEPKAFPATPTSIYGNPAFDLRWNTTEPK